MKPTADDAWFEALAGRPPAHGDAAALAEASLLREALQRWASSSPTLTPAQAEAGRTALLAAARRDPRVVMQPGCTVCDAVRRLWAWPRLGGALALALLAWLAILAMPEPHPIQMAPGGDTLRSSPREGVQRLQAADPRAWRAQIVADLAGAGVTATLYERQGRPGFDADLPLPVSAELRSLLTRYGLASPPSGGLAVELEMKAAP